MEEPRSRWWWQEAEEPRSRRRHLAKRASGMAEADRKTGQGAINMAVVSRGIVRGVVASRRRLAGGLGWERRLDGANRVHDGG